jgi:hypothetical protein
MTHHLALFLTIALFPVCAPFAGVVTSTFIINYFAGAWVVAMAALIFADEWRTSRRVRNAIAADERETAPMREAFALEWHSRDGEP